LNYLFAVLSFTYEGLSRFEFSLDSVWVQYWFSMGSVQLGIMLSIL